MRVGDVVTWRGAPGGDSDKGFSACLWDSETYTPAPSPLYLLDWSNIEVGDVIGRVCDWCEDSHQTIYYVRLTEVGSIDFETLFEEQWEENPSGGGNVLGVDFNLYSTKYDAIIGDGGEWTYCDYPGGGAGFPGNCGPSFAPRIAQYTTMSTSERASAEQSEA